MKRIILFVSSVLTLSCSAQSIKGPSLIAGLNEKKKETFYMYAGNGYQEVSPKAFAGIIKFATEMAIKEACKLPLKPETVSVDLQVVSLTWNVKDLCKN